jgi:hypothetical protein
MVKAIIMVLAFIVALVLAPDAASTEVVGYFKMTRAGVLLFFEGLRPFLL